MKKKQKRKERKSGKTTQSQESKRSVVMPLAAADLKSPEATSS